MNDDTTMRTITLVATAVKSLLDDGVLRQTIELREIAAVSGLSVRQLSARFQHRSNRGELASRLGARSVSYRPGRRLADKTDRQPRLVITFS